MGAVRGLAEIVINVRDIGAMISFYTEVVGLEVFSAIPEVEPTIVFLKVADIDRPLGGGHPQVVALIDPARHEAAKGRFEDPARPSSRLNHIAFEIDEADYESEIDRLRSHGIEPFEARFEHMRAKALFFQDPEGNRLEFICHDSGRLSG